MLVKPIYCFDPEKNSWLIKQRKISFEEVIAILEKQGPIDVIVHPNKEKYPSQEIFIVEVNLYIYLVPFIQNGNKVFLKTIFPSRKMQKKYLSR